MLDFGFWHTQKNDVIQTIFLCGQGVKGVSPLPVTLEPLKNVSDFRGRGVYWLDCCFIVIVMVFGGGFCVRSESFCNGKCLIYI